METVMLASPNSLCGLSSFPSTHFELGSRGRRFVSSLSSFSSEQIDLSQKRWRTLSIQAQADCSSDGWIKAQSSENNSGSEAAAGSSAQFVEEPKVLAEKVRRGEDSVGRRQAVILSLAVPGALAMDAVNLGGSHPARALIQTSTERNEQKRAGSATENLKKRVSTFTLNNGMKWVVLERHNAPVVSCHTYANVGAANETAGMTGLAHLLEHLAFKGTRLVGTRDPDKEAALLDQLDDVFYGMEDAKREGRTGDVQRLNKK